MNKHPLPQEQINKILNGGALSTRACFIFLTFTLWVSYSLANTVKFSSKIQSINSSDFPKIETKITVFSRKPVPELSKDNFKVKEDGHQISDFSVKVDAEPVFISLVLDRSGSMVRAMPTLKRAAYDFIKKMDERAYVQLISFSSDIKKHTSFSNVPTYFKKQISRLEPFGATALYDAVNEGLMSLYDYPTKSRKVLVAFTDGNDQNAKHTGRQSTLTVKKLVKRARKTGIPLYLIGLGGEVNQRLMDKMAKLTGGVYLHANDTAKLAAVFRRVAKMVELGYEISYQTPNPKYDGTWRKLQVSSKEAGKKDQGKGRYKAPDKPKPAPKKDKCGPVTSALGIKLEADPAKFEKEELNAHLIKHYYFDEHWKRLDDREPAKGQVKANIEWANDELRKIYLSSNKKLGPVLAKCVSAIAREDFPALEPLVEEGRQIFRQLNNDMANILKQHKQQMRPMKSQIQDKMVTLNFGIWFLYTDQVNAGIRGQTNHLNTTLFGSDLHNNTYRKLIEAYNHSVRMTIQR